MRCGKLKGNISADSSFYLCNAIDLKRIDLLKNYLDIYQFYAGTIILNEEISDILKEYPEINDKIKRVESKYSEKYNELFKVLSKRNEKHINEDGEYEAIGIAIELAIADNLSYLILDDHSPSNFAKNQIAVKFPELFGKIVGTVGFIRDSYLKDSLITRDQCVSHLKSIYQTYLDYQKMGKSKRPCSMDEKFVNKTLLPLIKEVENNNE